MNETQKIARLYVSDGVAHGAYTHVVHNLLGDDETNYCNTPDNNFNIDFRTTFDGKLPSILRT